MWTFEYFQDKIWTTLTNRNTIRDENGDKVGRQKQSSRWTGDKTNKWKLYSW